MVREYKKQVLDSKYIGLLSHLGRGSPIAVILSDLNIKYKNYYKKLKYLEKHRYITVKRLGKILSFELQPKAVNLLSVGIETVDYEKKISLHDFWLTYPILRKPIDWNEKYIEKVLQANSIGFNTNDINNWKGFFFDYASVKVRVTPNKVMFCPPEIELDWKDSPDHAKNMAFSQVDNIISKIERLFSISLSKPDKVSAYVSSQHIAFVNSEFARYFTDRDIRLVIYDEFGKKRIIVDKSGGQPELECVSKANAEDDAEKIQKLIDYTATGKFDPEQVQQDFARASSLIAGMAQNMEAYGKHIKAHTKAMICLAEGIDRLNGMLDEVVEARQPLLSRIFKRLRW